VALDGLLIAVLIVALAYLAWQITRGGG